MNRGKLLIVPMIHIPRIRDQTNRRVPLFESLMTKPVPCGPTEKFPSNLPWRDGAISLKQPSPDKDYLEFEPKFKNILNRPLGTHFGRFSESGFGMRFSI